MALAALGVSACALGVDPDESAPDEDAEVDAPDVGSSIEDASTTADVSVARDVVDVTWRDVPAVEDLPRVDVLMTLDAGVDRPAPMDVPMVVDSGVDRPAPVDVTDDVPVDRPPASCVGASTQSCGACGTQTRVCTDGVWSSWGSCVEPTISFGGNWRVDITPRGGGAAVMGLAAFSAPSSAGSPTGVMVDSYGYAELTAVTVEACTRRVSFTKRYTLGSSTDLSFRYVGTFAAGTPDRLAGTWTDVSSATNTSSFAGQSRSGRAAGAFAGSWRLTADWGSATSTTLSVSATGALTGTMVDAYGTASLSGAVDLGAGVVMFVKSYVSGSSMGQQYLYAATLDAAGARLNGGTWSGQGMLTNSGTWSATR